MGEYDRGKPLIIDPVLSYATYLGGTGGDVAYGIAVDSSGNAYITGITNSSDFPTLSPEQSTNGGNGDAFVAKLDSTGTALIYSTYLGGAGADTAAAIAVDSSGDAFVTGTTTSADFPTTSERLPNGLRRQRRRFCYRTGQRGGQSGLFLVPGRKWSRLRRRHRRGCLSQRLRDRFYPVS